MKNLLWLLASVIICLSLFSCKSEIEKERNRQREIELDSAKIKAQNSEILVDTIFLGFRFGMTEREVMTHFKKLIKQKKIYLDDFGDCRYELHGEYNLKYTLGFITEYYKGKLFKMTFLIEHFSGSDECYVMVFGIFKKANPNYSWYIVKNILGDDVYTSISHNLIVTFEKFAGESAMIYENAPISLLKEKEEKIENEKKIRNTLSDF